MSNPLADTRIPLAIRVAAAAAALAYTNAKIEGNVRDIMLARAELNTAVDDVRICLQAAELGV